MQHIVDEIEADLLITKYTYHNYYVGDEKDFKERVKVEFTDNDGNKKLEWESIEAHEEKNLYFDRAYKMHREYIDNFMKNVNIVPDHGHQVALSMEKFLSFCTNKIILRGLGLKAKYKVTIL